MATLPDGTTVSEQTAEGFEDAILVMGDMTISATNSDVSVGETVTISGTTTDSDGSTVSVPYTVEARDADGATVKAQSGTSDSNGDFSETLTFQVAGEYTVVATNDLAGKQFSEGFEG
jgi:plastocyanin